MGLQTEIALFAGAGGSCMSSRMRGHRIVCYVEKEPYRTRVLRARIADGHLDDAPIWDDARTFDGHAWKGRVDIISAGFPCQPFSCAGKQRGAGDSRNMWPEVVRIVREVRPDRVFLENVPGLLGRAPRSYFGCILRDLATLGFDAEWGCLSAAQLGAWHRRNRLWILAYRNDVGR